MTRIELIQKAVDLKIELIKQNTHLANTSVLNWTNYFKTESNKQLILFIENNEPKLYK